MRTLLALLLITSATATTVTTAQADTNRDELWIGGGGRALRSPSANALTGLDLSGPTFAISLVGLF
jgi:hypothetical protein